MTPRRATPAAGRTPGRRAIRAVAAFEATKGVLVLLAASGLLALLHEDLHAIAARLIGHLHLNPAARAPRIFVDALANLDDRRLVGLALGAAAYAACRLAEAWGLFHDRAWAEWLAAGSGAIYVPFELANLGRGGGWLDAAALAVNLAVVALMLVALRRRRRRTPAAAADGQPRG
jgi:uncharacterized membrane protein (DUF2068 family)